MKSFIDRIKQLIMPSRKGQTVLVVDDSELDRKVASDILSDRFTVVTASNGWEGVAMAKKHEPDLVLLDFIMPDLQGPEVCRILKEDAITKDIPVIFLTSMDSPSSVTESFEQGAEIFLTKPVRRRELLRQVQTTLELHSANPQGAVC